MERIAISQLRRDLENYEAEFVIQLLTKRAETFIEDNLPYPTVPAVVTGEKFYYAFNNWKAEKLVEEKNPSETFLINKLTLPFLRQVVRRKVESFPKSSLERTYWMRVGQKIVAATEFKTAHS